MITERVRLRDVCTVVSGSTPKSNVPEYWDGDVAWITPAEITGTTYIIKDSVRHITQKAVEDTGLKPFPAGTVILSSRAPIGKTAIAGREMYCNQGFKNLICSSCIENRYLYWFLSSKTDYLNSLGRGATFKEISKSIVENVLVPLPEMTMQKKIADQFEAIAALITKRKEQLAKLDELVKARFVELFGDERALDRWLCCTVGDVADVCVGVVIKPAQYYTDENGIPAFRSLNIGEMEIKNTDWVYFTAEGHKKNQKSIVKTNDVLVVRSGAPGTACVVTEKYDGYNAVDIIIAHPNLDKINPIFLAAFTNMPHGMNQIRNKTGGAAQQHFNVGGYRALKVILPPLALQQQFADFVFLGDKSKEAVNRSLAALETLKKSLMQQYFG